VLLRGAMKAIRATGTSFLVGRLRLATGLVLFAYVVTHDLNHMLGIVSLEVMEEAQYWFDFCRARWFSMFRSRCIICWPCGRSTSVASFCGCARARLSSSSSA
jgi:hypothetical protein